MDLVAAHDEFDNDDASATFCRFKISDGRTFESLFFPDKDGLMKRLNDFQNKAGGYARPGVPHKLGVLLHGPPGKCALYTEKRRVL